VVPFRSLLVLEAAVLVARYLLYLAMPSVLALAAMSGCARAVETLVEASMFAVAKALVGRQLRFILVEEQSVSKAEVAQRVAAYSCLLGIQPIRVANRAGTCSS
jgi:hypothetical protein